MRKKGKKSLCARARVFSNADTRRFRFRDVFIYNNFLTIIIVQARFVLLHVFYICIYTEKLSSTRGVLRHRRQLRHVRHASLSFSFFFFVFVFHDRDDDFLIQFNQSGHHRVRFYFSSKNVRFTHGTLPVCFRAVQDASLTKIMRTVVVVLFIARCSSC